MKKLGCLLLALLMVTAMTGCSQKKEYANKLEKILATKKIVMVTSPDFAPNEFIDSSKSGQEQYVGSDIELGKYIAEKLGVELQIEAMDFQAVLGAVTTGKADIAISGLGWLPERAESMELSKGYNFTDDNGIANCHGVLVKKDKVDSYKLISDFDGKKIAVQLGSLQEGYTKDQIKDVVIENVSSLDIGLMSLKTDKIEGLATSCRTGELYAENNDDIIMANPKFFVENTDETAGTRIGMTKGEKELVEKINEIIDEVVAQGLYDKWYREGAAYAEKIGAK